MDESDPIYQVCQEASYKLSDYIRSKPPALRPVVMAVIYFCITANLETASEIDRELFNLVVEKSKIVIVPEKMDPRRWNT